MSEASFKNLSIVSLMWLVMPLLYAQTPSADGFNPGTDGEVVSIAAHADGKILLGGLFATLDGQPRNCLGRLNPDGTLDTGFNPAANNGVHSLAVQADGKILVGGYFTTLGGKTRKCLGRLNSDGTLDTEFDPGADGQVDSLAVQADGNILVGGYFTRLGGKTRNSLGRLNSDGTLDTEFDPGAGGPVHSLAVQADGKILAGGQFTTLGGQRRDRIGRLNPDGTLDTEFNPGAEGPVYCLAVQADGKILAGGGFTTLRGQTRNYIGRLNLDGTPDTEFNPDADSLVLAFAVQADGAVLVGGWFTKVGRQTRNRIARLNPDGTLDDGFNPGAGGSRQRVSSLAVQADGTILVGGEFSSLGGQARMNIGRLNATEPATHSLTYDGSTITWLRGGTSPDVWRTEFEWSTDGLMWTPLGDSARVPGGRQLPNTILPTDAMIRARGFVAGGRYNASGWFVEDHWGPLVWIAQPQSRTNDAGTVAAFSTRVGGTPPLSYQWLRDGVALADGGQIAGATTARLTLTDVLGTDAGAYQLVVSNAFGALTSVVATLAVKDPVINTHPTGLSVEGGRPATLKVTATGFSLAYQWYRNALPLEGATNAALTFAGIAVGDAGDYRVMVSSAYGVTTSDVARVSVNALSADAGFRLDQNYEVRSLTMQPDGKTLTGSIYDLDWQSVKHLGRLNGDGSLDSAFDPAPNQDMYCTVVQADGKIVFGGRFTVVGVHARQRIARINLDGSIDAGFNPGADGDVTHLLLQPDGRLLVAGKFRTLGSLPCKYLGRLTAEGLLDQSFVSVMSGSPDTWEIDSVALQTDGRILVGASYGRLGRQFRTRILRLTANGSIDQGFTECELHHPGTLGPSVNELLVQPDGRILVGGYFTDILFYSPSLFHPATGIARLNTDGSVDTSFSVEPLNNPDVRSMVLQTDGKVVIGGHFGSIGGNKRLSFARVKSDGTLDLNAAPFLANANSGDVYVEEVLLQSTGKILVAGIFDTIGEHSSRSIGRLINTEPATQSLTYDGSRITWLRGGTSPEVWRTTFEVSGGDGQWSLLGVGARVLAGWELDAVAIPTGSQIRARGYTGQGSIIEVIATLGEQIQPQITSEPQSATIIAGQSAMLSVAAAGSEPLSFQWYAGAAGDTTSPVPEATSANFTTLTLHATAQFWVRVTNAAGNVDSHTATVTVLHPPQFTQQPENPTIAAGQTTTLTVVANGSAPLTFQWYAGATGDAANPVAGATEANFTTPTLEATSSYWVRVSNAAGTADSQTATVTVLHLPGITTQPQDLTITAGQTATLTVVANGSEPLTFQWYTGAAGDAANPVAGATEANFTTPTLQATSYYWVRVSNGAGNADSHTVVVTVTQPSPPSLALVQLTTGTLRITITGPVGSRWRMLRSTDLVSWQTLESVGTVELSSGQATVEVVTNDSSAAFYVLTSLP